MNSHGRVVKALRHQEADRVLFDLGRTGLSSIHVTAYRDLRRHLGLPAKPPRVGQLADQLALADEGVARGWIYKS